VSPSGVIAAVTEALQRRLTAAIAGSPLAAAGVVPLVTMLPLDRAIADNPNGVNIFLYEVLLDPTPRPPLPPTGAPARDLPPLRLRYLVGPLGPHGVTRATDHALLGVVLHAMHERPILDARELGGDTARITPLVLSAAELAALWSGAGASVRVSLAYEVSHVVASPDRDAGSPPAL
jgi:hypothetical protein